MHPQHIVSSSSSSSVSHRKRSRTRSPAQIENGDISESEEDVELHYDDGDDEKDGSISDEDAAPHLVGDLDPSIQSLWPLLSMPASGEVKAISMSPFNGLSDC